MFNSLNKIDNSVLSSVKRLLPLNMKRSNNNYLFAFVANHLIYYPTPISLRYVWSFGFLAGMCLLTQMISGIFLVDVLHIEKSMPSFELITHAMFQLAVVSEFISKGFKKTWEYISEFFKTLFTLITARLSDHPTCLAYRNLVSKSLGYNPIRLAYTKFVMYIFTLSSFSRYFVGLFIMVSFIFALDYAIYFSEKYIALDALERAQICEHTKPPAVYDLEFDLKVAEEKLSEKLSENFDERKKFYVELVTDYVCYGMIILSFVYLCKYLG